MPVDIVDNVDNSREERVVYGFQTKNEHFGKLDGSY